MTGDPYCLKMRNGAMVSVAGGCPENSLGAGNASSSPSVGSGSATSSPSDVSNPVISIVGNNPATITVGTGYVDLGATVTDTNADGSVNNNLGLHYSVNGVSMNDISINTTATSTNTVVYSAVDGAGNWGYATRTVEVIGE